MANDHSELAHRIKSQATVLSEAYRLRLLGRLWWANLLLVVLPAALATAAAIFAASADGNNVIMTSSSAAWLAGGAAVLTAIHRALKCEEYQSECLRLSQAYHSIALEAESTLSTSDGGQGIQNVSKRFVALAESAKAPLPTTYIAEAEQRLRYKLHGEPS